MSFCERCGSKVEGDNLFCPSCGASLKPGTPRISGRDRSYRQEDDLCFDDSGRDPLDVVEFGLFLLVVGVVFWLNPNVFGEFIAWVTLMADLEAYVNPPAALTAGLTMFFGLIGGSNVLTAAMRLLIDKNRGRILTDVLSGVALLTFTYLLILLFRGEMAWTSVLAIEAIVVGASIILYSVLMRMF